MHFVMISHNTTTAEERHGYEQNFPFFTLYRPNPLLEKSNRATVNARLYDSCGLTSVVD